VSSRFITVHLLALLFTGSLTLSAARNDVVEGNPASSVKVLIYEDLQCADCARFQAILDGKLLPKYGSRVAFIHRDFPLGKHDWAREAAIAARWVFERSSDLGIAIRRELIAEQNSLTAQNLKPWLVEFAIRNHLDSKGIVDSLNDHHLATLVDQDMAGGVARGVSRTPTVFAGGQMFSETIVYEDVARALDDALK
jgi:protein-disulfide isomerase